MEPHRFGRKLGIGVRVASRMAKERAAQAGAAAGLPGPPPAHARSAPATPQKNYAEPARRVGEGTRRFGKAFLGPLAHAGSTLWLEITGLLFALFALFFAQNVYKTRLSVLHGPEHAHFLAYSIAMLVFLYFSISSFVKAARRSRRARS